MARDWSVTGTERFVDEDELNEPNLHVESDSDSNQTVRVTCDLSDGGVRTRNLDPGETEVINGGHKTVRIVIQGTAANRLAHGRFWPVEEGQ